MANRKTVSLVLAVLLAVMLISCSAVFEAGISGKVVTDEGTGKVAVPDVNVFAYTDKGLRDSDFTKFSEGSITRPTEGAGYVATSLTNANGEFVVNKIVWESKKSEFGKTADVNKLYLIFYHEDYVPAKTDATIISGSTNQSNVYVTLEGSKDYTTVNVTVYDVATGRAMGAPATLSYWVNSETSTEPDTVIVTGNTTFQVSYKKGTTATIKMYLKSDGTHWKMTDKDGKKTTDVQSFEVKSGTKSVSLYMRNDEITLPAFSGNIDGSINDGGNPGDFDSDYIPIRLAYKNTSNAWVYFAEVDQANLQTYWNRLDVGSNVYYQHGFFSGVGNSDNYSIVINQETYPDIINWATFDDKTISLTLKIEFEGRGYKEFGYTERTNPALGHLDLT